MDRRTWRGNMGNRNMPQYRTMNPVCSDMMGGYKPEETCDRNYERDHCEHESEFDSRFPIGMCYVPWQCFRDLYENEFVALKNGTLFKELDLKWYGRGCK